jgi:cellulose synthase/poly-beta-1,6-N-acetylglucosamine synthase-like glycosyltransferase
MASDPSQTPPAGPRPEVSVVVPVYNESGAAPDLAQEIAAAFQGWSVEILFVDDCSRDDTRERLAALKPELPSLRLLAHAANAGQSRAVRTGVLAARGDIIVTLDGDGQNDPADAPRLVEALKAGPADLALVGGERVRRQANDTGCGLKAFRREAFLRLPYFDHIHRYLPALMLREGYRTAFLPVGHRPRTTGASKYTNLGRLWASLSDLRGVMWLQSRARPPGEITES